MDDEKKVDRPFIIVNDKKYVLANEEKEFESPNEILDPPRMSQLATPPREVPLSVKLKLILSSGDGARIGLFLTAFGFLFLIIITSYVDFITLLSDLGSWKKAPQKAQIISSQDTKFSINNNKVFQHTFIFPVSDIQNQNIQNSNTPKLNTPQTDHPLNNSDSLQNNSDDSQGKNTNLQNKTDNPQEKKVDTSVKTTESLQNPCLSVKNKKQKEYVCFSFDGIQEVGTLVPAECSCWFSETFRLENSTLSSFGRSALFFLGFTLIFSLFGFSIFYFGSVRPGLKTIPLLRWGLVGKAVPIRTEISETRINHQNVLCFLYSFIAQDEKKYEVQAKALNISRLTDESAEIVFYNAQNPEKSVLLDTFPKGIKIDDRIGFSCSAISLILPILLISVVFLETVYCFSLFFFPDIVYVHSFFS